MKKLWAIFLLFVILMAGCANVTYEDEKEESSIDNTDDIYAQLEESLPVLDYSDESGNSQEDNVGLREQSFVIFTDEPSVFVADESEAGVINGAVRKRNDFLYDKYGAVVTAKQIDAKNVATELKAAIESGTEYCDMLAISGKTSASLALSGLLTDMNTLPDFNVENSYFQGYNAKALATNSTLYLLPDTTALYYEDTYALFFNRNLVTSAGCEDPETLVMQGKWTWDKFLEISMEASNVYGKSVADIENDIFAYAAYYDKYDDSKMNTTYPLVIYTSGAKSIIGNTYKNPVDFAESYQDMEDYAKRLRKYYDTKGKYGTFEGEDAAKAFKNGRLVFFCNRLSYLHDIRTAGNAQKGSEYGLLPMPKLKDTQVNYYCLVDCDARVLSVPATVANDSANRKKFVSYVISANCAAGKGTVETAFVANYITDFFNNNTEAYMFKTICASATFDFANVFDSVHRHFRKASTSAIREYFEFSSDVTNSINNALNSFQEFNAKNFT